MVNRKSKFKRLALHSMLTFSLMAVAIPTYSYADGTQVQTESVFDVPSVGSVWINDKSFFEIKDARQSVGAELNTVTFTLKIYNGGTSDIQFIDYWIRLASTSGANFTVSVVPQDKDKNTIPAGGTQEIKFYANVTNGVSLKDLQFKIIKWDFSAADYQKSLGVLQIPETYTTVAPAGYKSNIKIAKTSIQSYIKKSTISSNEENFLPTILLELQNTDSRSLKLPTLNYMIRTSDGLLYPLKAAGLTENTTIDPLMKKEITLSGKLPRSISADNWQLVITENTDTGNSTNISSAVAEFVIPKLTDDQSSTEKEQSFSNQNGTYIAKLNSIQRVPWDNDDLLSAVLTLKSKEAKSLAIPNLTGYIELEDSVKVDIKVIKSDNVIGLQPDTEVRLQLLGRIPYTYDYSNMKIVLQEKSDSSEGAGTGTNASGTLTDLVTFKVNADTDNIPLVGSGDHYQIGGVGRSADYKIHDLHQFTGKSSNLLVAQVELTNLEKRPNDISKLVAHFKGSDGNVYPATITEIKTKISPSGKALLNLYANLPKTRTNEITQLLIGEGITDGKFTTAEGKPDSYVNVVSFALPTENVTPSDSIKDMNLFPYTLGLSRVGTSVTDSTVKIKFDYELNRDSQYEINTDEYKVIVELKDVNGDATLESTFDLEKSGQSSGSSNSGKALLLGKNKMEVSITDADFLFKVSTLKKYQLNIYHQFQGNKKLVATKELDWFVYSD
ncbi:hypothetical protein ACFFNY_33450 [Paenibacillus hodogayensis]|uniref:Uncharacterized protein n=1 Tax=Paenibacillus hodogayensis TaxID=279208 RepID=A0ABV5W7E3_9BACL